MQDYTNERVKGWRVRVVFSSAVMRVSRALERKGPHFCCTHLSIIHKKGTSFFFFFYDFPFSCSLTCTSWYVKDSGACCSWHTTQPKQPVFFLCVRFYQFQIQAVFLLCHLSGFLHTGGTGLKCNKERLLFKPRGPMVSHILQGSRPYGEVLLVHISVCRSSCCALNSPQVSPLPLLPLQLATVNALSYTSRVPLPVAH